MSPTRPDTIRERPTADYQPAECAGGHVSVVVANPDLPTTADLQPLLLRRLRSLSVLFLLPYFIWIGFFVVPPLIGNTLPAELRDSGPVRAVMLLMFVVLLVTASLAVALWVRRSWSLAQLRAIELVFVATLAIRCLLRGWACFADPSTQQHVQNWRVTGEEDDLLRQLGYYSVYVSMLPALSMLAYGVFIPNTGRRCALVVAVLWSLPLATWVLGCIQNDIPVRFWIEPGVMATLMLLTLAAALAVFGSHRIETLQRQARQARRLGQYALRKRLGGGGMGEVYLADHVLLRRPCALKLIRPERAGDPAMLQRFEREVRATATLTHPNAVQIFDYGRTEDGTFYYVMEYLPGLTLEQLVKENGPLTPARAVHFLRQLCGALHEAHSIGLIHRDIKPGNVMVCERGLTPDVAKLLDFGLVQTVVSAAEDDRLTREGAILGTPAYMSPEQTEAGRTVDARSDVYSLGALAYFLLTGRPPFDSLSPVRTLAAHLYEAPPPVSRHRPDVPPELEAVILRCLAKSPEDRFADVESLARALAECESRWTEAAGYASLN